MESASRRAAEYKAARRAVARRLHPDVGGDPAEYLEALAAVDQEFADTSVTVFARSRRTSLVRTLRSARTRLRRRRYVDL